MKIYRYLKKEKKKKKGNKQSCWIKLKYFRSAQRYNPSIVEKSAPTLGKQRTTKCSVDEGIKRKINIPSRDKLGDGIRVKSAPTPPSSKASSFDPSRTMDRRTDSRARFSNISSIEPTRDSCAAAVTIVFPIETPRSPTIDKSELSSG